ncbi:hypothetical protein PENSTE_c001G10200 [Penicillium steckii]|uniref:Uncharacterized protein n=1 Tax=Penicillium steckii TaxID=303698 RepID=A0A1V6U1C1_9EURO|nr:hypothetical protein PENSTE_c001G10200 [Penicillium steckii]
MSSTILRTGTSSFRLRSFRQLQANTKSINAQKAPRRALHSITKQPQLLATSSRVTPLLNQNSTVPRLNAAANQPTQLRTYAATSASDATADNLIEEIQDLYEIATDEFEIATDSTDSATIYAASDRESARDALNQLVTVYELYTGAKVGSTHAETPIETGEKGPVVETNFDPEGIKEEVRGEVKKRVGQRVRELKNAVEILEEKAHEE